MIFLDTNVLNYASGVHGSADPRTETARRIVTADEPYASSVQVLQEFYDVVTRKPHGVSRQRARDYLAQWREFRIQSLTLDLLDRALEIEDRFGYRYWDCAILAAAVLAGCDTLYSEDMQHGQIVDGTKIVNPFIQAG